MTKHHPENERIKRAYQHHLEDALGMAAATVDQRLAAIAEFEWYTGFKDFRKFHIQQARGFKAHLNEMVNPETGKPLAKATIRSRLMALKAFFQWLAGQPGYKSRIAYPDAEYFNLTANDERIATAHRQRWIPTLDDIRGVLDKMPAKTDLERRDRALVAFAILSGARDDAMASFSLKHVELAARTIFQDARDVRTKNRKSFTSEFFPVGDDIETIVGDWIEYLARERNFGPDDPLFPATGTGLNGEGLFCAAGLSREHWKNASAIRRIFKGAFEAAGLPYANPHSFRKTLTLLGQRICSPEQFKAWSQNLGHEHVLTTYCSYGTISPQRQAEIFASLRLRAAGQGNRSDTVPDGETIRRVLDHIKALAPA